VRFIVEKVDITKKKLKQAAELFASNQQNATDGGRVCVGK
jgi:hypothetical protein